MWLYTPTSLASALEAEDSTSASDWRAKALAQSVTWNEKHSPWRTWSRRFRRVSWTTLLFGAISPPSMATLGVELRIGSLAASRASRTAPLDSVGEPKTNGISGQSQRESSERPDPSSSSWRTFRESQGITTNASGQSYEEWVTQLRKDYSRRLRSVRRTSDSDYLSWPTPNAGPQNDADANWSERRAAAKQAHGNNGFGLTLGMATSVWPTPNTPNGGRGASHAEQNGRTYTNKDGQKVQVGLEWETRRWPTPTTVPEAPNQNSNIKDGGYKTMIQASQGLWPTPSPSKDYSRLPLLPSTNGHMCSPQCRRLNPRFVSWLMGWPPLAIGRTDLDCLAMEWSRWWQLMRSALSQLEGGPDLGPNRGV